MRSRVCTRETRRSERVGAADATELTATAKASRGAQEELDALGASLELSSVTDREKIRREDLVAGLYGRCDEPAGLSSADAGMLLESALVDESLPARTGLAQRRDPGDRGLGQHRDLTTAAQHDDASG